jgi:hypothetical protein
MFYWQCSLPNGSPVIAITLVALVAGSAVAQAARWGGGLQGSAVSPAVPRGVTGQVTFSPGRTVHAGLRGRKTSILIFKAATMRAKL